VLRALKGSSTAGHCPSVLPGGLLGPAGPKALLGSTRRTQPSDCLPGPFGPGGGSRGLYVLPAVPEPSRALGTAWQQEQWPRAC